MTQASTTGTLPSLEIVHDRRGGLLVCRQWIPRTPEEIFAFFGDAHNLEQITPPLLRFRVLSCSTPEIRRGTVLRYRLALHGVPLHWRTVIDRWDPPHAFTDRQAFGPFRQWVHDHEFTPVDGGTLMTDRVRFRVWFGSLLSTPLWAWMRRDLESIFLYRRQAVAERFGS
jgi:hypothetical protein